MTRYDFIMALGKRGIPFFNLNEQELEEEFQAADAVAHAGRPVSRAR